MKLILPQMQIFYPKIEQKSELILISGGREPNFEWFKKINKNRPIYCVDHGIDFCKKFNILPDFLIGDFDSAAENSINWSIANGVKIERHPVDKDFTDTQLALDKINDKNFVIITGAFGGRFDHLYSTIFTCANSKIKNCLIDESEAILFINGNESVDIEFFKKPFALSLLPMNEICEKVTINGVHWKLKNANLKMSIPNAISNRVDESKVTISIENGILAIYMYFSI